MATTEPLSDLELTTFEAPITLDLSTFDTVDEVELAVVETVARSIVAESDHLDEDDTSYVSTQVDYDESGLEDAFADDDVGIARVETVTELAIMEDCDE